jgi:hypothetical protein
MDGNYMHVYGQTMWHDEVHIVADTKSLLALKKAIEDALETGSGAALTFCGDGEGYNILIAKKEDGYDNLATTYTEEIARERNPDAVCSYKIPEIKAAREKAVKELENLG